MAAPLQAIWLRSTKQPLPRIQIGPRHPVRAFFMRKRLFDELWKFVHFLTERFFADPASLPRG